MLQSCFVFSLIIIKQDLIDTGIWSLLWWGSALWTYWYIIIYSIPSSLQPTSLEARGGELQVYETILRSLSPGGAPKLSCRGRLSWLVLMHLPDWLRKRWMIGHQWQEPLNISEPDQQGTPFWKFLSPGWGQAHSRCSMYICSLSEQTFCLSCLTIKTSFKLSFIYWVHMRPSIECWLVPLW